MTKAAIVEGREKLREVMREAVPYADPAMSVVALTQQERLGLARAYAETPQVMSAFEVMCFGGDEW